MSSGAPSLSLTTTHLSPSDDPSYNPFADTPSSSQPTRSKSGATGYAGPYSANTPSTSVLRPRRRGSDSLLGGQAPLSPTIHARAQTLDISAPSPSRPIPSLQRRRSDYTKGLSADAAEDVQEEEEGEDEDHPLRRRSSSRSVRSTASTKPRLRAALAATKESGEDERERERKREREARRKAEGQRAVLVHQVTPTDSLPGVSLKYGISLSDLRKANQLWAHDSIHLRSTLLIPLDQARNARIAVVDAAAEGVDLLSPDGDIALSSSPQASGSGLLSPDSSDEPLPLPPPPPPRLSQDPSTSTSTSSSSSRPARSPTRTRTNHPRSSTEPPTASSPPHLTVTRVPASRLSFFPPPAAKARLGVRASEELARPGDVNGLLGGGPLGLGRARAGSDLPHRRPSPRTGARNLFSLLTPPASSLSTSQHDYFSSTSSSTQGPDALAAAKSLGRAAGRAAGWLADALAIPVPPLPPALGADGRGRGDAVELDSAGKGKGKARTTPTGSGTATPKPNLNPWFTPRAPSPSDSISTTSSASLSPFVPPRAKNRPRQGGMGGIDRDGVDGGEGIRMASSPPRVQAQPEARRGMVVPTARR